GPVWGIGGREPTGHRGLLVAIATVEQVFDGLEDGPQFSHLLGMLGEPLRMLGLAVLMTREHASEDLDHAALLDETLLVGGDPGPELLLTRAQVLLGSPEWGRARLQLVIEAHLLGLHTLQQIHAGVQVRHGGSSREKTMTYRQQLRDPRWQ